MVGNNLSGNQTWVARGYQLNFIDSSSWIHQKTIDRFEWFATPIWSALRGISPGGCCHSSISRVHRIAMQLLFWVEIGSDFFGRLLTIAMDLRSKSQVQFMVRKLKDPSDSSDGPQSFGAPELDGYGPYEMLRVVHVNCLSSIYGPWV